MALYLVVHSPRDADDTGRGAMSATSDRPGPRWLRAWSPDLHDDRIFTLWEAASADDVRATLEEFGFLNDLEATPIRVREWGPDQVLAEGM